MKKSNKKNKEWKTLKSTWETKANMKTGKNKWKKRISTKPCNNNRDGKFKWNLRDKPPWKPTKKMCKRKKSLSTICALSLKNWDKSDKKFKTKCLKIRRSSFSKSSKASRTSPLKGKKSFKKIPMESYFFLGVKMA